MIIIDSPEVSDIDRRLVTRSVVLVPHGKAAPHVYVVLGQPRFVDVLEVFACRLSVAGTCHFEVLLVQHLYQSAVEVALVVGVFDVRQNFVHLVQVVALAGDVQLRVALPETLILFVAFKYLLFCVVVTTTGLDFLELEDHCLNSCLNSC